MIPGATFLSLLGLSIAAPRGLPNGRHYTGHDWNNPLTVSTSSGHIHGKIDSSTPNVRQFLGIPYAQPPLGDNRWLPAQTLKQPRKHVNATELPPSCIQYLGDTPSVYTQQVLEFNLQGINGTGSISEDCLTLSVWAPADVNGSASRSPYSRYRHDSTELLPVVIFLYGGSFTTGGQDVPYQIPAQWVERTQDHLVVSLNYRLNIFGFPNAAGLTDQNLGILDQRFAVEWLKQNIAQFGGNPDQMTLWGQSAGSISVDYYNFAWHEDPIVKGLIMDSGTAQSAYLGPDPIVLTAQPGSNFSFVAENVGCANLSNDPAAEIECMRGVDALVINDFVSQYQQSGTSPPINFRIYADEKVIFSNYTERAQAGYEADIPAIIGTNAQEGVSFAPYNASGPDPAIAEYLTLEVFFCPASYTSQLRQGNDKLTYRFSYNGNFSNISPAPWMGAYHTSELPMIMGTHPNYRGPSTELEYATSEAMQDAYLAFARDPYKGLPALGWQAYTAPGSDQVREFGAGVAAQDVSLASEEIKCNRNIPAVGILS